MGKEHCLEAPCWLEFTEKAGTAFWDWVDSNLEGDPYDKVVDHLIQWDSGGFIQFVEEVVSKYFSKEQQESFCKMLASNVEFDFALYDTRDKDIIYESYIETICEELDVDPWK